MKKYFLILSLMFVFGCTQKSNKETFWIYTSLYKDTIADLQPLLQKEFPNVDFQFYQAGSEEVAAKVQAEKLAGDIQADMVIASDRFWFEEMKTTDQFEPSQILSYPVMIIAYNNEMVSDKEAPHTFKELTDKKWKDKVSMGSPLASGTTFSTVAALVKRYDWDYFKTLRANNLIAEGGNSGVTRRLQSKERPVGIVLLENILRFKKTDPRMQFVVPEDGAVIQSNNMAIVKKNKDLSLAKKVAEWMLGDLGQQQMAKSYMYPAKTSVATPAEMPTWDQISKNGTNWTPELIAETMKNRESIKDQFSKIIF